jgi:hypothetical protein
MTAINELERNNLILEQQNLLPHAWGNLDQKGPPFDEMLGCQDHEEKQKSNDLDASTRGCDQVARKVSNPDAPENLGIFKFN